MALLVMSYRLIKINLFDRFENMQIISLFLISLISTLSWITLAKVHQYIHSYKNLVLWLMGYVRMLIYTLLRNVIEVKMFYYSIKNLLIRKN